MRQLVQLGRRGSRKHRRERRTIPGGCRRDRPSWRRIAPTQAGSGGVRTAYRAHRGDLHRGRASFRRKLLVTGPRVRRDRVLWWSVEASARQPALLSARRRKAGTPGAQLGHKVEPITLCLNRQCRMIAAGCRQTRKPARGCSVRRHPCGRRPAHHHTGSGSIKRSCVDADGRSAARRFLAGSGLSPRSQRRYPPSWFIPATGPVPPRASH